MKESMHIVTVDIVRSVFRPLKLGLPQYSAHKVVNSYGAVTSNMLNVYIVVMYSYGYTRMSKCLSTD